MIFDRKAIQLCKVVVLTLILDSEPASSGSGGFIGLPGSAACC